MKSGGGTTIGIWYAGVEDGECYDKGDHYNTDDQFIKAARSGVTLSMLLGFGAGVCIAFEWLLCALPLLGCLEGCMLMGAWFFGCASFLMYASEGCADVQGMIETESAEMLDGDVDCEYGAASTYMTMACLAYIICHILLCWYVIVTLNRFVGFRCVLASVCRSLVEICPVI